MIRPLFLMFLMSFQVASSHYRFDKQYGQIDPEFKPYVQELVMMSGGRITEKDLEGLTMGFRKYPVEDSNTLGTYRYTAYEIDINIDWWKYNTSQYDRFELIAHEMGHAVLKRKHTDNGSLLPFWMQKFCYQIGICKRQHPLNDGCPRSIMHPYIVGEDCISKHYPYYIEELFDRAANETR